MGILKEFKEFAMRGNVVDMAVGVVIGGAFGKIVTSAVNDIIMPPIGLLLGNMNFSDLKWTLKEAIVENGETLQEAVTLNYGAFIQVIIDFILVALAIFILIKAINAMNRKKKADADAAAAAPAPEPEPTKEELLLTEIRDLLAKK